MFMRKSLRPLSKKTALALALAVLPFSAFALSSLNEDELSQIDGQQGLTEYISSPGLSAAEWRFDVDAGGGALASGLRMTGSPGSTLEGYIRIDVGSLNSPGTTPAIRIANHIDRFRLGGAGTNGFTSSLAGDTTRNFGQWSLVSDLDFSLAGDSIFRAAGTADVNLSLNNSTIFYRQNVGHAVLTIDNLDFLWSMVGGKVAFDTGGIRISAPATTYRIGLDAYYKYNADQDMTTITANDRPGIRFTYGGTLYDSVVYARSGGAWNTAADQGTTVAFNAGATALVNQPTTGLTSGLNYGLRWNYRNPLTPGTAGDFLWGVGNITGDQEYLEFGDWKNLESATGPVAGRYGFDIPLLAIDALAAGSATNAGGSLCWGNTMSGAACSAGGGTLVGLTAGTVAGYTAEVNRSGGATFMELIRNGNLLAYSNSVRVKRNPSAPVAEDGGGYSWGLVSTMANINANIYFYPGGSESAGTAGRSSGAMGDILLTTQSFGNWAASNCVGAACNTDLWTKGTHLMIADTAAQMGVGFLGSSILLAADDMRLWLKDSAPTSPNNLVGGIDLFSPRVRYNLKGLFGGARLPSGLDVIRVANIDMNLEGLLNFRLSPPPSNVQAGKTAESNDYLAYSGALRLRCGGVSNFGCTDNAFSDVGGSVASGQGSYIHIEEPGRAGVYLGFDDLSGDMAFTEGILQLRSAADTDADTAPGSAPKYAGATAKADLSIANKILMGASAASRLTDGVTGSGVGSGGAAGRAMTGNIRFGGNDIMSMAIPAGSAYYSLTIRAY